MAEPATRGGRARGEHVDWARTRILLDQELHEWIRHGLVLIAAGFGSFALFEGFHLGEAEAAELPRGFALAVTLAGVLAIASAMAHDVRMTRWLDEDEFGAGPVPPLPDERRPMVLGGIATAIGLVSCTALLFVP